MSAVRITYVGLIRNVIGKREEEISLPQGANVRDLLHFLIERHGEGVRSSLLDSRGELRDTVRVAVNNLDLGGVGGLGARLEGDNEMSIVVLLHPMAGGSA